MNRDFDRISKKLAEQASRARKEELEQEQTREKEAKRLAKAQTNRENKDTGKSIYNVVIIAQLEYQTDHAPNEKKLAEDIGHTIIKWADQKRFTGIDPKEPVPKLISLDVDIH